MPSLILSIILIIFFLCVPMRNTQGMKLTPTVIGIMTQPSFFPEIYSPNSFDYIGACYVEQLKAEGALVIPIKVNLPDQEILTLLSKINGVVIPGGDLNLFDSSTQDGYARLNCYNLNSNAYRFTQVAKLIFDYSSKLWQRHGVVFPLWGTCQGFQSLLIVASQKKQQNKILEDFFHWNISGNIVINREEKSEIFSKMTSQQLDYAENGHPFFYWHQYGISPEKFESIKKLNNNFKITSTAFNGTGAEFVATFEGKNGLPIYASQFHPERIFVWLPNRNINHSPQSFETNQFFAKFLITQARKNTHSFENYDELANYLIEYNNYSLEKVPCSFMLSYFFKID